MLMNNWLVYIYAGALERKCTRGQAWVQVDSSDGRIAIVIVGEALTTMT